MKKILCLAFSVLLFSSIAFAAEKISIIASVGDEAITNSDLINRIKLMMISSGLENTPENAKKMTPQVLQSLINERLQLIDAEKNNITIKEEEIAKAIDTIETQNKMQSGQLGKIMESAGVPFSTLQQQVKAQIAWAKVKAKIVRPKVKLSQEEVDDFMKAQLMNLTQQEYNVFEIVLPVEDPREEQKTLEFASKLRDEIRSGKDFSAVAKQFSKSASAPDGGDVGWLAETQLPKEILAALKTTPINEISEPVRSIEGYFLLKPIAVRTINSNDDESTVNLKRFFTKSSAIKKLLNLKNANDACNSPESFSKKLGVSFEDIGVKQIKNLDPQIQPLVSRLETGEFSSPVPYSDGISSYLVCEKVIDTEAKVDDTKRKKAETILYGKKIEMEARKYLRDLRRQTNIEIKLDSIS